MPSSHDFRLSRKRQRREHPSETPHRQLKKQKLSQSYWDNLSKVWLTKSAIKELDRRNSPQGPLRKLHRPITRQFTELKHRETFYFAPDILRDCLPGRLKEIERFSRLGGPDLSDLRNYPVPQPMSSRSSSHRRKRRAESPPSSTTANTKTTTKTSSTSAYSRNFQQNLIDHRVYPPEYRYPDGEKPLKPNNWMEINEMLARSRASLSPSKFSEKRFEDFREADAYASKEKPVTVSVVPILDGDISDLKCVGRDYPFGNLAPLTDGTLASARPDHFYGARPEQLNRQIRKELSSQIVPSTQDDLPIAPNFFLEAKGPDGSLAVATRQACYDGALGARGMHSLRSYEEDESTYDNNAYTLTSTYHGGQLKLYTTHLTKPSGPDYRPEYIMTQLNTWGMTGNLETFRQGASAYRNARDWAKEKRAGVIGAANERFSETESQCHSASQHQTNSDIAATLDDSDISTVTDETEDAQWSFAAANKDVEDETQILSRNPKKSRVGDIAGNKITRRLN
ncbi:predicted protein [Histoplasma mississippiense (nom. inval.)]|uniref:predicted protein n=1 Tax=Ajellomyces capsulatus (strain NAm1 / WU24) TaxID=2059318 RepID=UPI000157B779|nr:predicted protein [Histoplasma mississippiense (nom. inval.)]EDN03890.1 predicted protein [Histoplasma mississippiense (nom. inval.)]